MSPLRSLPSRLGRLAAVGLLVAACAPGGSSASPATSPNPQPTTAVAGACDSAPAPANVPGWDTASQKPSVIPVIISSTPECGENRFLFSFIDRTNRPAATPDRTVHVRFFALGVDPAAVVDEADGRFIWAIEDERGVYAVDVTFTVAGTWGAEFVTAAPGQPEETIRVTFTVAEQSPVIGVGDKAPASETPTVDDVGGDLAKISTDTHPDPAFYKESVDAAIAAKQPFVLAFATPKFCRTAQCGPTLDRVKPMVERFPNVAFINVEPYKLQFTDGQLQPVLDANGQLEPVPAVIDWGLVTEPWIFVVDRDGIVRASFEGIVGDDELAAAIEAVA